MSFGSSNLAAQLEKKFSEQKQKREQGTRVSQSTRCHLLCSGTEVDCAQAQTEGEGQRLELYSRRRDSELGQGRDEHTRKKVVEERNVFSEAEEMGGALLQRPSKSSCGAWEREGGALLEVLKSDGSRGGESGSSNPVQPSDDRVATPLVVLRPAPLSQMQRHRTLPPGPTHSSRSHLHQMPLNTPLLNTLLSPLFSCVPALSAHQTEQRGEPMKVDGKVSAVPFFMTLDSSLQDP